MDTVMMEPKADITQEKSTHVWSRSVWLQRGGPPRRKAEATSHDASREERQQRQKRRNQRHIEGTTTT